MKDQIKLRFVAFDSWPYGIMTPLIQWWTGSWPSHVDALTIDNKIIGSAPFGGVKEREISEHSGYSEIIIINCSTEQRREFWEFMNSQIGKKYDWVGLFGFGFGIHDGRRWFCSEIIAAALNHAGIKTVTKPHKHSPASLYRILK